MKIRITKHEQLQNMKADLRAYHERWDWLRKNSDDKEAIKAAEKRVYDKQVAIHHFARAYGMSA